MGLSTASISIARYLEVLTKAAESDTLLKSTQSLDEIVEKNAFVKFLGEGTKADEELFNSYLADEEHGTIVKLSNCDRLTNGNITQFQSRLIKEIGRIFREYINAGREFYVNEKK